MKLETLDDFKSNIGKTIYRDDNKCPCQTCEKVLKNGFLITDESHAEYTYECLVDYKIEGIDLNYRTEK